MNTELSMKDLDPTIFTEEDIAEVQNVVSEMTVADAEKYVQQFKLYATSVSKSAPALKANDYDLQGNAELQSLLCQHYLDLANCLFFLEGGPWTRDIVANGFFERYRHLQTYWNGEFDGAIALALEPLIRHFEHLIEFRDGLDFTSTKNILRIKYMDTQREYATACAIRDAFSNALKVQPATQIGVGVVPLTYTVAMSPRFGGEYYCTRFLDFANMRGPDIYPDELSNHEEILRNVLQKVVNGWQGPPALPMPAPMPVVEHSSYGGECTYIKVTVNAIKGSFSAEKLSIS